MKYKRRHYKMFKRLLSYKNLGFSGIFMIMTLLYIAFAVKPWTSLAGNIYSGDDNSYYGYASSIVNDFDYDASNNFVEGSIGGVSEKTGKLILSHPVGTGYMLVPFYLVAKPLVLIDSFCRKINFNQRHVLFFIAMCVGIFIYSYAACLLLCEALKTMGYKEELSEFSVLLTFWGSIIPVCVFKRPIFSHVPEFFLISLLIFSIVKLREKKQLEIRHLFILTFLNAAVLITRWNDVHIVFFTSMFLFSAPKVGFAQKIKNILLYTGGIFIIFFFTQSMAWKTFMGGYFRLPFNPATVRGTSANMLPFALLNNFFHVWFALDWGIVYTMLPFAVGVTVFFFRCPLQWYKGKVQDVLTRIVLVGLPFILVLKWQSQAEYYGYRFLISLVPFAAVGIAELLNLCDKWVDNNKNLLKIIFVFIVMFNFFLILPFEYTERTSLTLGVSSMGGEGWINNAYIKNALSAYFTLPLKEFAGLFLRGFAAAYAFAVAAFLIPQIIPSLPEKLCDYYVIRTVDQLYVLLFYPFLCMLSVFLINKLYTLLIKGNIKRD